MAGLSCRTVILRLKMLSVLRLDHVRFLWKRRDLRACLNILMSLSAISMNSRAHEIDLSSSCSEIENGYERFSLQRIDLNYEITSVELRH